MHIPDAFQEAGHGGGGAGWEPRCVGEAVATVRFCVFLILQLLFAMLFFYRFMNISMYGAVRNIIPAQC